jgi:O-antigen/teichoic acid export membrane protein
MKSGAVTRNVIANVGGGVWAGLMGLAFIPIYVKLMGIEAYGLVGFFITLQAVFSLLDLGLSTTLNREFARLGGRAGTEREMRNLLRSLEVIYWLTGLVNAAAIVALSHVIAYRWVKAEHLQEPTVQRAIMVMGAVVAVQWPLALYSGGLLGLQRQVALNVVNAASATARGVGAILILWLVSPTIVAFFLWQVFVSCAHTLTMAAILWRQLRNGGGERPRFEPQLVRSVARFAAGVVGISALSVALTQMDKLVLSKVLTLEAFGYYSIAATVAGSLYRLVTPIFAALFPRFSQLVAANEPSLAPLYHRSCQAMTALVVPISVFVAFFSIELLRLWTRNETMARVAAPILTLLIIGTAVNGLMSLPYALQLAHGWTRLTLVTNAIAVVILAPALFFATAHYGPIGAAGVWCAYNVLCALLVVRIMHRRILPGEQWRWYVEDVGFPFLAAVAATLLTRLMVIHSSTPLLIAQLVLAGGFIQLITCAALPDLRRTALGIFRRRFAS